MNKDIWLSTRHAARARLQWSSDATRISIHPVEGCEQAPFTPCMTWADCEHLVAATDYELMAVIRHYRDGGVHELSAATKAEWWNRVHSLLEDLVDHNSGIRDDAGYGRCSPLALAAYTNFGCSCIAERLLEAHADVDGKHFEKSPLVAACESQNVRMANFLIHEGADMNRPTWFSETPLLIAASVNSAPLIRLLLSSRADVNQQHPRQRGPMERAFQHEAVRAAKCLVQAKAQVHPYTNNNCLLHQAACRGSTTWIKLLIEAGADLRQLGRSLRPANPATDREGPARE